LANSIDVYRAALSIGEHSAYGVNLDGDWALGSSMRWYLGGGYMHVEDQASSLNVRQARAGIERSFDALTFGLESDYRNDDGAIESAMIRLRGDWRSDSVIAGAAYGRRRIDVTFDVGPLLSQFVDTTQRTYNHEFSGRIRFALNAFAVYASGSYYDYDAAIDRLDARLDPARVPPSQRPILQQQLRLVRERLRTANFRALRLSGHLLEYDATLGVDYRIGAHLLNAEYVREREALTEVDVSSAEVGWVLPLTTADLEFRLGGSKIDGLDTAYYGGIILTVYR